MRGRIVHSDAMLVQVDVIFNPRAEPPNLRAPKHEDLWIKQGAAIQGSCSFARKIVVAHQAIVK